MNKEKKVLSLLKKIIKNTEYENNIYLVGGAVRDNIMGKDIKDLDFTVIGGGLDRGIEFSTWLAKKMGNYKEGSNPVTFEQFGTSKLDTKGNTLGIPEIELEFVAPRKEEYEEGSRKPIVKAGTLEDEAYRRDLTLNSLMMNVSNEEIIDITGRGIDDIKNGIIRTPLDANVTFKDDPLRMLRAIRFYSKYGFKLEQEVIDGIKNNAERIDTISKERVKDELNKILVTDKPREAMRLMKDVGLLQYIIPEFKDAIGMTQNKHHKDDVFDHSLEVLSKTQPVLVERLMALFHDIGKVLTKTVDEGGEVHFYGHEKVGEDMVKDIMRRLKYPNELIDAVSNGVRHHMNLKHGGNAAKFTDKTLRKFRQKVGDNLEAILNVIHADNIAHSEFSSMPDQISKVRERLSNLEDKVDENNNIVLPINGGDLIKLGLKPSVLVGKILEEVKEMYFENPNITKEDGMGKAKEIIKQLISEIGEETFIKKYVKKGFDFII